MTVYSPIRAVSELIAGLWEDEPVPPRCGISVCGATRLGHGFDWPIDNETTAYCGVNRCGLAHCGRIVRNDGIFAGMVPRMLAHHVTMALTPLKGGPADPRPRFDTAYDNPAFLLHVIGDNLLWVDRVAHTVREELDRTAHLTTTYGVVNTLAVGPPSRDVRSSHPRYDVTMKITTEMERA